MDTEYHTSTNMATPIPMKDPASSVFFLALVLLLGTHVRNSQGFLFAQNPTGSCDATGGQIKIAVPRSASSGEADGNTGTSTSRSSSDNEPTKQTSESQVQLFLDIAVADQPLGRLTFQIPDKSILPLHTENVIKLCTQERSSIDPRCKYVGCEFQHSPQFVEGFAQYRWGHTLKGKGRNAVGPADGRITDPEHMSKCTHRLYGGQYYGINYENVPILGDEDERVVLTVPLVGPGRGSTDLSIVRVGESPPEWKERLLLNSAVLGWLEPSSMDTLRAMARQTRGAPKVVNSGVL